MTAAHATPPLPKPWPDSIWVVAPEHYAHAHAFLEVAEALHYTLRDAGLDTKLHIGPADAIRPQLSARPLILGAHLLTPEDVNSLPEEAILYNLEQIQPELGWQRQRYMPLLARFNVWDYSPHNLAVLQQHGIHHGQLAPLLYHPCLTRITHNADKPIDVLFIGSLNARRQAMLEQLVLHGFHVKALFGVYGAARDAEIARSKMVLNLHYYPSRVLEMVRLSYLLANRCCIVSEPGNDAALLAQYRDGIAFTPYERTLETCLQLIGDPPKRQRISDKGFDIFTQSST